MSGRFIQIGEYYVNVNHIAFIRQGSGGGLTIHTTVSDENKTRVIHVNPEGVPKFLETLEPFMLTNPKPGIA